MPRMGMKIWKKASSLRDQPAENTGDTSGDGTLYGSDGNPPPTTPPPESLSLSRSCIFSRIGSK